MTTNSEANADTVVEVDVSNTDNLDDFEAAYYGTAEPKEEAEEVEEEVTAVDETDAEDEDADEDEADEDEEEAEEPEPEPEPKKNRKSAKERISELTAKVREAEQARTALEARLAKLETPEPKQEPTPAPKAADKDEGRPDPDAKDENGELVYPLGKFDPEFAADTVRWTFKVEREREAAAAAARAEEEAKNAEQTALVNAWNEKLAATEENVPELREKIAVLEGNFAGLEPTHGQFLVETIMSLDRGPEVLLYLADNLSEADAIVAASPVAATIALGRIEGRLSSSISEGDNSNKKKVSTAPKPPVAVRGTSAGKPVKPDTDDLEDFERVYYARK